MAVPMHPAVIPALIPLGIAHTLIRDALHQSVTFLLFLFFSSSAGPEYGTTEAAWKGILGEAESLSDLHTKIRDHMAEDVPNQIRSWQKEAYHKVSLLLFLLSLNERD